MTNLCNNLIVLPIIGCLARIMLCGQDKVPDVSLCTSGCTVVYMAMSTTLCFPFQVDPVPFYLGDPETRLSVAHSYGDATVLSGESLDYERRSVYLVKIRASDMAGCSSSCQVCFVLSDQETCDLLLVSG